MAYLIYALIVAVNLTPFLIPKLDIWHAQGAGVQVVTLLIFSLMFFLRPKYCEPQNKGVGVIFLWTGLLTSFVCFMAQLNGKYEVMRFFPFFNLLCLAIIYKGVVQYLEIQEIELVFKIMRISVIFTLFMCVLQKLNCSQFYQLFTPENHFNNNLVTGFIGNGTHLSGFLGMCVPLFFTKQYKRENIFCLVLLSLILCFWTGTGQNDVAISGVVVAVVCGIYYFARNKRNILIVSGLIFIGFITLYLLPNNTREQFFNLNGRGDLWSYYFNLSRVRFITGLGLGTVDTIYVKTPFPDFRHIHFEYLQFLFEGGIILIVAIIYFIKEFFERRTHGTGLIYKTIFLGFLVSGIFNYPMHLWLPSTYACIAYSCLIAFNERVKYARSYASTN